MEKNGKFGIWIILEFSMLLFSPVELVRSWAP